MARANPDRDGGELVERLHAVNSQAIDLTKALRLLSRPDSVATLAEPFLRGS